MKSLYVIKHPIRWAFFVFVLVEITYLVIYGGEYINRIQQYPIKSIAVLLIKLLIFVVLAYLYIYLQKKHLIKK